MGDMTEHRLDSAARRDYIPAAGHDALLPAYDLLTRVLGMNKVYSALIAQAELADGMRVLEIGCGTGNLTTRAKRAHRGIELVGSDPDPKALARAQRKARGMTGIRFEHGYAQQLPFASDQFDTVLSSMMLHHLDDDTKAGAAAEIHRVLRPGGTLHIVDIGGPMTPGDGLMARRMLRSPHIVGNLGDAIPRLLRRVGLECTVVGSRRHRLVGRLTFYRATRPA
jgi:ubiquinone/menaquinone biosynthesis C-methylase UbiE